MGECICSSVILVFCFILLELACCIQFFSMLYRARHVEKAAELQAVEVLLISDELFR